MRVPLDIEDELTFNELKDAFKGKYYSDRVKSFMTSINNGEIHKNKKTVDLKEEDIIVNVEDSINWCLPRLSRKLKSDFAYVSLYLFLSNSLAASQGELASWFNTSADVGDRYKNWLWDYYKKYRVIKKVDSND